MATELTLAVDCDDELEFIPDEMPLTVETLGGTSPETMGKLVPHTEGKMETGSTWKRNQTTFPSQGIESNLSRRLPYTGFV